MLAKRLALSVFASQIHLSRRERQGQRGKLCRIETGFPLRKGVPRSGENGEAKKGTAVALATDEAKS